MTHKNFTSTDPPARSRRRTLLVCTACAMMLTLTGCSYWPFTIEPTRRAPSFVMEEPLSKSPGERSVTYFGKDERRELAKVHIRFGPPEDETRITFDINKDKRSVMAEMPIARTEKSATYFSFGAHKDHKMMVGFTLRISF